MHLRAPPENGMNASLSHSPMNLSGLNACGSSQYRATQLFVNPLTKLVHDAVLTIIVNSRDADPDCGSCRDGERNGLSRSIPNTEGGVLSTTLRDESCLGLSPMVIRYFEICAMTTDHWEHPQGFVYCAASTRI